MRNNFFSKATALVMGLLVISSGQVLALSSDGAKLSNRNTQENSQLLISQESISVGVAVAVAAKVLNQAVSVVQTVAKTVPVNVPSQHRDIILPKLRQAQQSMAKAQTSVQKGNNAQVATAVSQAVSFMGEAAASATADAGSVKAITQAIAKANQAIAVAQGRT
jgi:hypothetical protein